MSRSLVVALLAALAVLALIAGAAISQKPTVQALPPAGTDIIEVMAEVGVSSLLGAETISMHGTITIFRTDPRMEGGVEVVDFEIQDMSLTGESLTGSISVTASLALPSIGELRSLQPPPDQFPASSFIDAFIVVRAPASPSPVIILRNDVPLHLVPMSGMTEVQLDSWPPLGVTYVAEPDPCLPLLPSLPAGICVTLLSVEMLDVVPGPTPLAPTATPTPELPVSFSVVGGGPSNHHPADILGVKSAVPPPPPSPTIPPPATPVAVSGNGDFPDGWVIPSLPFSGSQSTASMTTEFGEPTSLPDCRPAATVPIGSTVWYRLTAPASGTVVADTIGSDFDTIVAAYTGDAVNILSALACNDDAPGLMLLSRVSIPVTAGETYHIQVGGFGSASGELIFNVSMGAGSVSVSGQPSETAVAQISCAGIGLIGCAAGGPDEVDGLSYGSDFEPGGAAVIFSAAPGSAGVPGSGVAQQAACAPSQAQADAFSSPADGTNALLYDGDGLNNDCPKAQTLGLMERPVSDDVDALAGEAPSFVDDGRDGVPDEVLYFSLRAGSPSLAALGRGPADIQWTVGGFQPGLFASAGALGLQAGDDIDAFCLNNRAPFSFEVSSDPIAFSLAPGSPSLQALGASAADVLGPGPEVLIPANSLGLLNGDDLDALVCSEAALTPPPTPAPTATPAAPLPTSATPAATATPVFNGGPITAPDTGTDGLAAAETGGGSFGWWLALGLAGIAGMGLTLWSLSLRRGR